MLQIKDVRKSYATAQRKLQVLDGVSFSIDARESVALMGESGCGKSTLLHLIAGLDKPDSGAIELHGQNIAAMSDAARAEQRRTKIGVIFQQFNLIPSMDVAANLSFQARLAGKVDDEWMRHLIEQLGLIDFLQQYPEQLSGGQQQRVAIGRTLAAKPSLVLADEPTGNLDEESTEKVLSLMLQLVEEVETAFLMATHSELAASRLGRKLILKKGILQS